MTDLHKAVFLSYASEDATAALRICTALRDAGIEVWFDQSELRGGDAWDAAIRQQIRTCALFIPMISRNTHAREEGYFRLEWKIAVDRSHLMTAHKTFLLPVVIDDTRDTDPNVPDRFREVQWTRLPEGLTPPSFAERVARLLSPDAAAAAPAVPPPVGATLPEPAHSRASSPGRSKLVWVIAAAALVAVGWFVFERLGPRALPLGPPVQAVQTPPTPDNEIPEKSIAVLPFVNLSPDKDQEYFSDGLAEELIDQLSKIPDLRVPARSSSFYFKGKSEDIATMARRLRVAHLLEGSVRKSGNRLRVTAELIRADNGYHLWSETYDRELKDVFKVQDEIAGAVVAALKLKLAPEQPLAHRTGNTEAYNAYLLGRQFMSRGTVDGYQRAVDALQRAVALDPNFASAYALLGIGQSYVADQTGAPEGYRRAKDWAEKAVALDPQGADGYAARGYVRYSYDWNFAGAQEDFAKALALDPGDSTVQRRYSQLLAALGKLPEAIVAGRKSADADPLNSAEWQSLSQTLMGAGDLAGARAANARALEISPDNVFALSDLGMLDLLEGHAPEALRAFEKIDNNAFHLMGVSMAEHTLGHAQQSQQALDKLIATQAMQAAYQIAEVYAWRGEPEQAFAWLERAYRQRDGGLSNILIDPAFARMRRAPRFAALLRKMNIPQ